MNYHRAQANGGTFFFTVVTFGRMTILTKPPNVNLLRESIRSNASGKRRFWEHRIRDETDFRTHVQYIHYNPVHHRYATFPKDWPYSSFHRYVQAGKYSEMWGAGAQIDFKDRAFGE